MLMTTVDLQENEQGLTLSFKRCLTAHVGLRVRVAETRTCVRRAFRKYAPHWGDSGLELRISGENAASAHFVMPHLAEALAEIANRSLTPRFLVAALKITTRERLRWTKDGRLPKSGEVRTYRAAHLVVVPTYAISLVEELIARPRSSRHGVIRTHRIGNPGTLRPGSSRFVPK
jgi:hypothetical protein